MHEGSEYIRLFLLDCSVQSAYCYIVNIQFGFTEVKYCGTKGSDVIFECDEFYGNFFRFLNKSFKLLCKSLCCCNLICLLTCVLNHVIYNLVKSLGLKIHSLDDFRINLFNLVVSVFIRAGTCVNQKFTINLVQSESGVFQCFQDSTHAAECCFHSECVCSCC